MIRTRTRDMEIITLIRGTKQKENQERMALAKTRENKVSMRWCQVYNTEVKQDEN